MLFIPLFLLAILANLYILAVGTRDIETLKGKISIGKFIKLTNESLSDMVGDTAATIIKIVAALLLVAILIANAMFFLICILAIVGGVVASAYLYKVPAVSNIVNKIATYINRLRR